VSAPVAKKSAARIDVEALPFDQYQRYRWSACSSRIAREDGSLCAFSTSARTALRGFLRRDRVTLVDLEYLLREGPGARRRRALPFRDRASTSCASRR
jgi:hypothetical protein